MKAPFPEDEGTRLEALHDLGILDTPSEQAYEDITYLASLITQMPIALITFVDGERQWFKSRHGLEVNETDRDYAFCAHAILNPRQLLVVPDALADNRFADNPLVLESPSIRFYAGSPLVTTTGHALGTLCVIDRVPREFSEIQRNALCALSRQVSTLLELHEVLDHVKMLRGLIPICAKCKKIRDDDGYWQQVEEYVSARSEALFSHGICPDCAEELYPASGDRARITDL